MKASVSKSDDNMKDYLGKLKVNNHTTPINMIDKVNLVPTHYSAKPKDAEKLKLDEMIDKYIENVDYKYVCKLCDELFTSSLSSAKCHMKTHTFVKTDDPEALKRTENAAISSSVANTIAVSTDEGEFKFETANDVLRALDSEPVPPIPGNFH